MFDSVKGFWTIQSRSDAVENLRLRVLRIFSLSIFFFYILIRLRSLHVQDKHVEAVLKLFVHLIRTNYIFILK